MTNGTDFEKRGKITCHIPTDIGIFCVRNATHLRKVFASDGNGGGQEMYVPTCNHHVFSDGGTVAKESKFGFFYDNQQEHIPSRYVACQK